MSNDILCRLKLEDGLTLYAFNVAGIAATASAYPSQLFMASATLGGLSGKDNDFIHYLIGDAPIDIVWDNHLSVACLSTTP